MVVQELNKFYDEEENIDLFSPDVQKQVTKIVIKNIKLSVDTSGRSWTPLLTVLNNLKKKNNRGFLMNRSLKLKS